MQCAETRLQAVKTEAGPCSKVVAEALVVHDFESAEWYISVVRVISSSLRILRRWTTDRRASIRMAHRIVTTGRQSSTVGRCVSGWGMDSGMTLGVNGQGTGSGVLFYCS
jgi:hypothetical protein